MGRPSLLEARAEKEDGKVVSTWIGGRCVMVSEGVIYVDLTDAQHDRPAEIANTGHIRLFDYSEG